MTYLQEMAKHEAWMKQAQRNRIEFQAEMAAIEAERARAEALLKYDCSCDQDPLGVCPQHGPQNLTDAMYNATLRDCLAECAESNPVAPAVRYR